MTDREWCERKAHEMIAHETLCQATSPAPCEHFGVGLIQAFYALGLLTDDAERAYTLILRSAVHDRREALATVHPAALERAA